MSSTKVSNVSAPGASVAGPQPGARPLSVVQPPTSGRRLSNAAFHALAQRPSQSPERTAAAQAAGSRNRVPAAVLPRIESAARSRTATAPSNTAQHAQARVATADIEREVKERLDAVHSRVSGQASEVSGETLQDLRMLQELALLLSALMQRLVQRSGEAMVALTRN